MSDLFKCRYCGQEYDLDLEKSDGTLQATALRHAFGKCLEEKE